MQSQSATANCRIGLTVLEKAERIQGAGSFRGHSLPHEQEVTVLVSYAIHQDRTVNMNSRRQILLPGTCGGYLGAPTLNARLGKPGFFTKECLRG